MFILRLQIGILKNSSNHAAKLEAQVGVYFHRFRLTTLLCKNQKLKLAPTFDVTSSVITEYRTHVRTYPNINKLKMTDKRRRTTNDNHCYIRQFRRCASGL